MVTPSKLPTVAEAFSHNNRLRSAFEQAGFRTIIPIMLMPREALLEIPGIGSSSTSHVTKTLKKYGLGHHVYSEKMSDFINKQFGCVQDAPIGVLQVTIVRSGDTNRPIHAPLDVVNLLEDVRPDMTIMDLHCMSAATLLTTVEMHPDAITKVHNPREDLKHLVIRLDNYRTSPQIAQATQRIRSAS